MYKSSSKSKTNVKKFDTIKTSAGQTVDGLDSNILKHLRADSRLSYRTIAEMTGVSVGTVAARIRQMEADGVIRRYTALLDYEKLGFQLSALIELSVSKGKLMEVEQKVARMPGVCCVYDITGLTDALVVAKFRSRHELNAFVKSLLAMPYVERTNTHMVLNTVKESPSPE